MVYCDEFGNEYKNVEEFIGNSYLNWVYNKHELILVLEKYKFAEQELKAMVKDINDSMVSEEEILSNHLYLYQRETNKIVDLGEV